jgi:hypothetical protein
VLGEGCPRRCRAQPESGGRGSAECGLGTQEKLRKNGEIGYRSSGGAGVRER